jgi:hypothetical protein
MAIIDELRKGSTNKLLEQEKLLREACNKYEAAISFYHCFCRDARCECTRTAFVRGVITPARPIEWTMDPQPFDEYRCAEKVDRKRLQALIQDL